jgi:Uma2 family endonuclease
MGQTEFLRWIETQTLRHELVDGVPVAMAGARRRHDQIVVNATAALHRQLRGTPCRAFSADTAVLIPSGNVRYADAGVDCGAFLEETNHADQPAVVLEVLSPSTRQFDLIGKLEEYKTVPSLRHIVLINPDEPQAIHWTRTGDVWTSRALRGLDAAIAFNHPSLTVLLADLFEGLEFRPRPRLVEGGAEPM